MHKLPTDLSKIEQTVGPAQHRISGNMTRNAEIVKQTPLDHRLTTHHLPIPQTTPQAT